MANKNIGDLTISGALQGDELFEIEYDPDGTPVSRKLSLDTVKTYMNPITSVGDSDISGTDVTYDLDVLGALAVGCKRIVSWHSGDGSHTFSFDNSAGKTINNADGEDLFIGEGEGHLIMEVLSSTAFKFYCYGEIWDVDASGFSDSGEPQHFKKYITGECVQWRNFTTSAVGASTITMGINFSDTLLYPQGNASDSGSNTTLSVKFSTFAIGAVNVVAVDTGTFYAVDIAAFVYGRWTSLYPRLK